MEENRGERRGERTGEEGKRCREGTGEVVVVVFVATAAATCLNDSL